MAPTAPRSTVWQPGWRTVAFVALVIAVGCGTAGVALYDASVPFGVFGGHVPLLQLGLGPVFTLYRAKAIFAALLLNVASVAWVVFLAVIGTRVVLATVAGWRITPAEELRQAATPVGWLRTFWTNGQLRQESSDDSPVE